MAHSLQNFTITAGDTAEIDFIAYESDGTTPLNLAGADLVWHMTRFPGDASTALLTKSLIDSIPFGITAPVLSDGAFTIQIDAADTADIMPGLYFHAARVTDASSHVSTIAIGFAVIEPAAVIDPVVVP